MGKIKLTVGILAMLTTVVIIFFILRSDIALLTHPKGIIAHSELKLIATNIALMLIVVVPTLILLFTTVWKYRSKNASTDYAPKPSRGILRELILWIIPSPIIAVMAVITWNAAHKLDPYRPLESEIAPLEIQVVALDWKWLFIYPDQGIATVNFVQFPAGRPIHFSLSADGSPMNSFWIPQLSGQIYAMTGMTTSLHIMADESGEYAGRAAEINGRGYAGMTFVAKSTLQSDFDEWVASVKKSSLKLTDLVYNKLVSPSENHPIELYSEVENGLFHKIVMKPMGPH